MAVYITGDTHGDFKRIKSFSNRMQLTEDDTIIILGDAGINYFLDQRDIHTKIKLSSLKPKLFCIHGNHECRPSNIETYNIKEEFNGKVYYESQYPNILFAVDGEIYNFPSSDGTIHKVLVCGGAYSVDKFYRLSIGAKWFPDEQPDKRIRLKVEESLNSIHWDINDILTHTGPLEFEPREMFLTQVDQSSVDKSTEIWLQSIYDQLKHFDRWFFGHYHCDKNINNKIYILFNSFMEL